MSDSLSFTSRLYTACPEHLSSPPHAYMRCQYPVHSVVSLKLRTLSERKKSLDCKSVLAITEMLNHQLALILGVHKECYN